MRLVLELCVFATAVLPLAACVEVTDECTDSAPVTIEVEVWPGIGAGLEGVQLCESDTTNCAMTDTNGEATLCLPFDAEASYTKTREGYGSYLQALVVPVNGLAYTTFMATEARLATQLDNVMSPYPMMGTGIVLVSMSPAFAEATFNLSDASGKATGKPFYRDEELNWRLDLTATTADGAGGFTEVPPGEYQVLFGGTADGCIPERGWPGSFAENSVRFPVLEGHMTQVTLVCPPQQP